jgi:hypothetical protein
MNVIIIAFRTGVAVALAVDVTILVARFARDTAAMIAFGAVLVGIFRVGSGVVMMVAVVMAVGDDALVTTFTLFFTVTLIFVSIVILVLM